MAFNKQDGTGYASFHKTTVPSAGKQVQLKSSKMANHVLIQHILDMHR